MKKPAVIIIVLLIIAVIIFFIVRARKKKGAVEQLPSVANSAAIQESGWDNQQLSWIKILNVGTTAPEVELIQLFLNKTMGLDLDVDGVLGPQTKTALQNYDPVPTTLGALWTTFLEPYWPRPQSLTLAEFKKQYV